jgi:hypothetical protein
MRSKTAANYEIGFGKPPRHTQFQQGCSGNPKGRPCGSKNSTTLLIEALQEPVIVSENGRRKKITKKQAIIKQIVNKAASGDHRAIQFLFNLLPSIEARLEQERKNGRHVDSLEAAKDVNLLREACRILKELNVPDVMELSDEDLRPVPDEALALHIEGLRNGTKS